MAGFETFLRTLGFRTAETIAPQDRAKKILAEAAPKDDKEAEALRDSVELMKRGDPSREKLRLADNQNWRNNHPLVWLNLVVDLVQKDPTLKVDRDLIVKVSDVRRLIKDAGWHYSASVPQGDEYTRTFRLQVLEDTKKLFADVPDPNRGAPVREAA